VLAPALPLGPRHNTGVRLGHASDSERIDHGVSVQEDRGEVVVLDYFALLMPDVFGDNASAAEHQPPHEVVASLALIGRSVNRAKPLRVVHILHQEQRPDRALVAETRNRACSSCFQRQASAESPRRHFASLDVRRDAQYIEIALALVSRIPSPSELCGVFLLSREPVSTRTSWD